jgi:ATP-dependent 26S proteasome regulatory subunit
MSQILNTLDGFDDKGDTIRFFTANNKDAIFSIDALINRMSSKLEFYYPDKNIFKSKLERFMTFYESYDTEKADKLVELVHSKGITVRPFVNYVVRYLFDPNPLDTMITHINELN